MIESMMPVEEGRVIELARKLNRLADQMGDIEGANRGHLNLPSSIADAYRKAYRQTRNEFDDTRIALNRAVRIAETVSPGCSAHLLKIARESAWN